MIKETTDFKKASDKELLSFLKEDKETAFNEIFFRYWEKLFVSADKLLNDEDAAKDVVQNVFIKLWKNRSEIEITNLFAYLFQATKYQVISQLRRGKFSEWHEAKLEMLTAENDAAEIINSNELRQTILSTLEKVPARCREIFCLSRFNCLSNKEIANEMDISIRTVETQISKALKFLRENFDSSLWNILLFIFLFFSY